MRHTRYVTEGGLSYGVSLRNCGTLPCYLIDVASVKSGLLWVPTKRSDYLSSPAVMLGGPVFVTAKIAENKHKTASLSLYPSIHQISV